MEILEYESFVIEKLDEGCLLIFDSSGNQLEGFYVSFDEAVQYIEDFLI